MNIYNELKIIAEDNKKREHLIEQLVNNKKIDLEGYDLTRASIISGCEEKDEKLFSETGERLDNVGRVDDEYYLDQRAGYMEDDFFGTVFYATDEPGTFIAIPFYI